MTDAIDITTEQRKTLSDLLRRFLPGVAVWAYGSRVKWTARPNSDLDLVAFTSPAQQPQVADLKEALAESNLPFPVNLHVWDDVPERFREIIRKDYVVVQEATQPLQIQAIAGEWTETNLGRLLSFTNGRSSPDRADGLPYPVYGSNGIIGYACEGNAEPGSIIIGRVGSYCGSLYLSKKRCWVTDNAIRAVAVDDNDPRFLYYLLSTLRLNNWRAGSGQPLLNQDILSRITSSVPKSSEQRAIAHILGTLDDKIELNQRMNETLEAMARALFKSWFVDFDPVRAKAAGRDTGLPKHLANLFPDSFEDSELGEIPRGWEIKSAGDLAEITSGKRPAERFEESSNQASVPLWGGNGPMAYVTKPLYNQPLLLTGRVGTLGSVFRINTPCWPSDNTLVLLPRAKHTLEFLFLHLRSIDFSVFNRGSTQPLLTQTDLKSLPFATPREEILHEFHKLAENVFLRIDAYENESSIIARMREALLPKLISGELRVKNAEGHIQDTFGPADNQ